MNKSTIPFAWRTFMFALPGHDTGPLALGTGTNRNSAIVDAYERMVKRNAVPNARAAREVASKLQATLELLAGEVTARRAAFQTWFGDSKVATGGEPMVVFHGASADFGQFDAAPHRAFGAHFGNASQVQRYAERPDTRLLPVYLAIRNPVRVKDTGTWDAYGLALQLRQQNLISADLFGQVRAWNWAADPAVPAPRPVGRPPRRAAEFDPFLALRRALEDQGIDGVVYLNRSEAADNNERKVALSDADFAQLMPRAQDSWIAFRPEQVRRAIPQREIPPRSLSTAIAQVYRNQQFWRVMLQESQAQSGPFDGGCLIVAQALIQAAGRGELVRVASEANAAEHYGARIDGVIYDFDGAAASERDWVERVASSERSAVFSRGWHVAHGLVPRPDIVEDHAASAQVAEMLRTLCPILHPQLAWSYEKELDVASAVAVLSDKPGRYVGVEQMGHGYVNDETHLAAISFASDANLARRMAAIGYDPAKAKLVLNTAARSLAAEAEIDLKLVDWSEVTAEFMPEAAEVRTEVSSAAHGGEWLTTEAAELEASPSIAGAALTVIAGGEGRRIDQDVLEVLRGCTVDGNLVRLPPGRLALKLYRRVNDVLTGLGGRCRGTSVQAHIFDNDPAAVLQVAVATGTYVTPQDFGYFPTPQPVVQQLLELAGLEEGMSVLEPEAGRGAIALAAADVVGLRNVTCVELLPDNVRHLQRAGFGTVRHQDFLKIQPGELPLFDRVVMNPPFSRLMDVEHVLHATRFLKPDGRLVGITAPSWEHNTSRKAEAFRDFFQQCEGTSVPIPAGAFRESGTEVATRIVVLEGDMLPWHRREIARERQRA